MVRFSALVTCLTECVVVVEADDADEARAKMERGDFVSAKLWDGGLPLSDRFHDVEITNESFGQD